MNTQIYEEATTWLIKHREGDLSPGEKGEFDSWLRESPQHLRAYLEMSAIWEDVPALGAEWNPKPEELIARAQRNGNVRPLIETTRSSNATAAVPSALLVRQESVPKRASRARPFALAVMLLIAIAGVASWYGLERNTYATDIGEQRSIVLNDGSTLELNSRSRVRVRYTDAQRDLDLLEGQALFRVSHNAARPFVVHSGMTQVLAVGTQFDVYKKRAATVITVVEGKVEVLAPGTFAAGANVPGAARPELSASIRGVSSGVLLTAGEQLTIPTGKSPPAANPSARSSPQPANIATATAWTQHNLRFESAPLTEVAEEFNRYNRRPLIITTPEIASMRISGLFSSADPALLLKFLRSQPELTVAETDEEIRIGKR